MRNILFRKKEATVIENMLVSMISLVMVCAFLVIVFGAFSSINDKWSMRQAARETLLIMAVSYTHLTLPTIGFV